MQSIRGRRRWRVDWRGHGRDGEGGRGTPEPTLPPLSSTSIFAQDISIPPILTHHPILRSTPILTHHSIFYTPTDLHITFHMPTDLHINRDFRSTCHPTIITHISPFIDHIFTISGVTKGCRTREKCNFFFKRENGNFLL